MFSNGSSFRCAWSLLFFSIPLRGLPHTHYGAWLIMNLSNILHTVHSRMTQYVRCKPPILFLTVRDANPVTLLMLLTVHAWLRGVVCKCLLHTAYHII